jgi:hypothetical protein
MFKPKLAKILSTINTQVAQLSQLVEENRSVVETNNTEILTLQEENNSLAAESAKAQRIASRLTDLVS